MNMQDVTNLAISEGDVRTIHDSSNNLLWGKLSYDTKYAGDTFQQTYSGKNLFDTSNYTVDNNQLTITRNDDGSFTVNGTSTSPTTLYFTNTIVLNGDYTFANIGEKTSGQGYCNLYENINYTTTIAYFNTASNSHFSNFTSTQTSLSQRLNIPSGTYSNFIYRIILVKGTYNLSNIGDFEQYVGGIPAPNPDYPQAVQTVTGEQTVTIDDGINTHSYTVNLGSIELCKIGDYQDYIYKSGDDWYVHKAIGKVTLDGTETITSWSSGTITSGYKIASITNLKNIVSGSTENIIVSDYFTKAESHNYLTSHDVEGFATTETNLYFRLNQTLGSFATWLSTHNTTVYYALATPTDTQITDNTLIGQLEAVHEWLTRYGYNSTVSGTLPLIIEQTNLS